MGPKRKRRSFTPEYRRRSFDHENACGEAYDSVGVSLPPTGAPLRQHYPEAAADNRGVYARVNKADGRSRQCEH